jgi:hypothetical protein
VWCMGRQELEAVLCCGEDGPRRWGCFVLRGQQQLCLYLSSVQDTEQLLVQHARYQICTGCLCG